MSTKKLSAAPPTVLADGVDPEKWESVPCAFCHGKGTDPYNSLSEITRCEACHGRGTMVVPRPHVACSLCQGTGSDKTFRCPACHGAGVVGLLPEPTVACPDCDGRGSVASSGMECLKCRGQGVIPAPASHS